jgi:PAS domain S-box-containing protein
LNRHSVFDAVDEDNSLNASWEDGEFVFCRAWRRAADGKRDAVLVVHPAAEHPAPATLDRLAHEYGLKDELDGAWAVRPMEIVHNRGRTVLVLEDFGGEPLDRRVGSPMEVGSFLRLAISIATALGKLHRRGLIHKDLKPAHIVVNSADEQVRLTGFGLASRLPRERQAPEPPEFIAGTLAYMAPEQTGRMNRSIDSRSDLYALGVTFYQMLTGGLPFSAADPMEWVHCHIARQPVPPCERLQDVPGSVSAIIMKLLAKTAEERYQTAAGAESDLRRCLAEWETRGRIDEFSPGEHDTPDRLLLPEKLYGRETEIDNLLAAFDRVVAGGRPELVLVSGYSGIGKSSVVNELHKPLVPPRGLFASGKFDQYKRDIPYATLAKAFQSLVRPLLSKPEAELRRWREALIEALDPNGRLIVDLVPELHHIIGEQPPVPELPPRDAQGRFQLVFRRFINAFARPEHPLALFLDDLQWLDAATLDLLEDLLTRSDVQHLLLIGAYRDNEVDSTHPLMRKLEAMRQAGAILQDIVLAPLTCEDLGQLVADSLRCEGKCAAPLAQLIREKTTGNPFFAIQFITTLAEEGLLTFDYRETRWFWDLNRIRTKGYTDNVVDLMAGKLNRLPVATQKALQQLACMGNSAEFGMLSMVYQDSEGMHGPLWEAVRTGLIFRADDSYTFLHDRVQEAAYSLIPEELRAEAHLRIGRLLAAHTPPERLEEGIFEIVNQLNRGAALITSAEEQEQVAELNLIAGRRAKQSTAYDSALTYLAAGRKLLPEDRWERCRTLTFALELHQAECEFLTGALAEADERLAELARREVGLPDLAVLARLQVELFTTLGWTYRAIEVCLDYLRHVGIEWSAHPTKEEVQQEYESLWNQIGRRSVEDLVDLPLMIDPERRATMDVLTAVASTALFTDENLPCLVICRMANISLEYGNSDGSCYAYAWLGVLLGPYFGEYRAAFRFGKLGLDLMEQRGLRRFEGRVYLIFGHRVIPWTQPIRAGRPFVRRAFDSAKKFGDLTFAAFSCDNLITSLLATGDPLSDVEREAEAGLGFERVARFGLATDLSTPQLRIIRTLRGLTPEFGSFNDADFDESRFERYLEEDPRLATAACRYWNRKLQARFFAGAYASAIAAAANAERVLWTSPYFFELAEHHLYAALTRGALCDAAPAAERTKHLEALAAHHRQLQEWAENCPENFAHRAALVAAEIARIEGRTLDAEHLYEQAIRSAQANGFVHIEALANELAARFYAARGFEKIARVYLRNAHYGYLRWGADGKVRQLDQLYPHLREVEPIFGPTRTIGVPVEHLDLATVIKVSQAVSGEIVLDKLIEALMRTAIEQAGAARGLLILSRGPEHRIAAEATTVGDTVLVELRDEPLAPAALPESVLHYVVRTGESVILDDTSSNNSFAGDQYFTQNHTRSILCMPLMNEAKLTGQLYLENSLAPHVFTPNRIAVLRVLASQAAISLENARLHTELVNENRDRKQAEAELRASEERWRGLFESVPVGVALMTPDGRYLAVNHAFQKMLGYSETELLGRSPIELTHEDERAVTEAFRAARTAGDARTARREKRYRRKDGSVIWVDISSFLLPVAQGSPLEARFAVDITERKQAEAEARDSERRYRELQMEMAHANRVATMGQLSASIAHEVNQPIAAVITNAQAGLRWLGVLRPNLEEVRQSFSRIVRDGNRAGEVIDRIRALVRRAPPRRAPLDINEAVREVIALAQAEMRRNRIQLQTRLGDGLPHIAGDRVQLQQVTTNLIVNAIEAMSDFSEGPRELTIVSGAGNSTDVFVEVQDTGPGLDPANLDRLFQSFYTTKPNGMGMGLAISRSIVEAHGGQLSAAANQPHGAVFRLTLPVEEARPPNPN